MIRLHSTWHHKTYDQRLIFYRPILYYFIERNESKVSPTTTAMPIYEYMVLGHYAQSHYAQGHYAQGHYAQGNYAQTEITPKEIRLFKENSSDFFQVII